MKLLVAVSYRCAFTFPPSPPSSRPPDVAVKNQRSVPWQGFPTLLFFSHGKMYKYARPRKLENLLEFATVRERLRSVVGFGSASLSVWKLCFGFGTFRGCFGFGRRSYGIDGTRDM